MPSSTTTLLLTHQHYWTSERNTAAPVEAGAPYIKLHPTMACRGSFTRAGLTESKPRGPLSHRNNTGPLHVLFSSKSGLQFFVCLYVPFSPFLFLSFFFFFFGIKFIVVFLLFLFLFSFSFGPGFVFFFSFLLSKDKKDKK